MSDQFRNRNEEPWSHEAPGKRLEKKTKPVLTPAQAQKRKEKIIMTVSIIVAVVMVIAAAIVLLYNRWVKKPDLPPAPGQSSAVTESQDPDVDPTPEETLDIDAIEPKVGGERKSDAVYTILIFGTDTTSGLTDTMMVATYDVTNQKAAVMSLPRDTLINSSARPGIDAKKLNAVYKVYGGGESGAEALKNEVSELVGFKPDYYVMIDWELVGEMVDAIGGVWFDNPYHMEYYDPYQDLNIYQEPGYRKINGDDAMQIVRWRHNGFINGKNGPRIPTGNGGGGGDLDRLNVQHTFLKAVLKQTLQLGNVTRVGQLIKLFNSRVESDLAVENMLWFGQEAIVGGLQVDDVEFLTMPNAQGSYGPSNNKRGFVYPIQSELLAMINEYLNPYQEQVTIRQLDLMSPNGNGGLRSSTGRLAAPELAYPPVEESDEPEESDPVESGEPDESGAPSESGEPQGSAPVSTGPVTTDPVNTDPAVTEPVPAQTDAPPAMTKPAWLDNTPEPTAAGEPSNGDWGETTD